MHAIFLISVAMGSGGNGKGKGDKDGGEGGARYKGVDVANIIPKIKIVEVALIETPLHQSEIITKQKKRRKHNVDKECPDKWYGGIGIREGYIRAINDYGIVDVFEGYPADLAGLMVGDIIVSINQPEIIGTPGTSLTLKIKRGKIVFDIVITRGKVCY